MSGVNKVILIGNLGKDPEIKYFENNIAKVSFSLATTEYYKDKNGQKTEQTEWHNIVMWRGLAENASKLLKKGSQIYLEGKIQSKQWIDKEGNKKNMTEILAENFTLLNSRNDSSKNNDTSGSGDLPY
ncbi:MAG TPA: single-stranded DNA-binding protein [Bacteroidia bacterium]|nr:single-stranded DNA-binding protein [Bacteroidia bacterium]